MTEIIHKTRSVGISTTLELPRQYGLEGVSLPRLLGTASIALEACENRGEHVDMGSVVLGRSTILDTPAYVLKWETT